MTSSEQREKLKYLFHMSRLNHILFVTIIIVGYIVLSHIQALATPISFYSTLLGFSIIVGSLLWVNAIAYNKRILLIGELAEISKNDTISPEQISHEILNMVSEKIENSAGVRLQSLFATIVGSISLIVFTILLMEYYTTGVSYGLPENMFTSAYVVALSFIVFIFSIIKVNKKLLPKKKHVKI